MAERAVGQGSFGVVFQVGLQFAAFNWIQFEVN